MEVVIEEWGLWVCLFLVMVNVLYSSNFWDDMKVILEQISVYGQKYCVVFVLSFGLIYNSFELGCLLVVGVLVLDMFDKDKCLVIFCLDSLGIQGWLSCMLLVSVEECDWLLCCMESMCKEKCVYSCFEVFCKKEEVSSFGVGEGFVEEGIRDSKVGKFVFKILGMFKSKK